MGLMERDLFGAILVGSLFGAFSSFFYWVVEFDLPFLAATLVFCSLVFWSAMKIRRKAGRE